MKPKLTYQKIFTFLCLTFLVCLCHAQQTSTSKTGSVASKLARYTSLVPQEKVYLHLDRSFYGAGDSVLIKAYLVKATTHQPSQLSKTLYVNLTDSSGQIQDSILLHTPKGLSHGSLKIPSSIAPGKYQINAYTNWMKNFNNSFFFRKSITVLKKDTNPNPPQRKDGIHYLHRLDFLPEGGDLVNGIATKVAVKAYDINGNGIQLSDVKIKNSTDDEVTTFSTDTTGYGLAFFKPELKKGYHVKMEDKTYSLPEVKSSGATITVTHRYTSNLILLVIRSKNLDIQGGQLLAHQKGKILFAIPNEDAKEHFALKINKQNLPEGMIHLTYFDAKNRPLTERLLFTNLPASNSFASIIPDQEEYKKRSKVLLSIKNPKENLLSASLTINPSKEKHFKKHDPTILTDLIMTSDLKDYINSPGYYLQNSKESYKARDLIMLTHGWSRFTWSDVLSESKEIQYPIEKGINISGRIVDYYNREKGEKAELSITITGNGVDVMKGETSNSGGFDLFENVFFGSTPLIFKATGLKGKKEKKDENVAIVINEVPKPNIDWLPTKYSYSESFEKAVDRNDQIRKAFFFDEEASMLDEVVVTGARQTEIANRTRGYSEPDSRVLLDSISYNPGGTVIDLLRNVSGVTVTGSGINQSVSIRGVGTVSGSTQPLFILDGARVSAGFIQNMTPQEVEFIDVLKGAKGAVYGIGGGNGVVLIYTKTGKTTKRKNKETKGLLVYNHPGYHAAKEFYSPDYSTPHESHAIPDYRSTLHWEPNVKLEDGSTTISFYSSDGAGEFDIRLEGITTDGEPFFIRSSIQVK